MPTKNVSLLAPTAQPYDLAARGLTLQQQEQLAQALIAQSMENHSPIIHTGGGNPFARDVANIGDPIADIAKAYIGGKQRDEANKGINDLNIETRRRTQEDMGKVTDALMGRMEGSGMPPTEGQPNAMTTEPDYAKAIRLAQESSVPGVNDIAKKLLEGIPTPDKYLQYGDKYSQGGLGGFRRNLDPTSLAERPKTSVHDNVATTVQDGKVTGTQPVQSFEVKEVAPGLPASVSKDTGEAKALSGGVTTPTAKYEEQYSAGLVDQLKTGKVAYLDNMSKLNTIAQVQQELSKLPDEKFGTVSSLRNAANRLVESIGGKALPETSSMEVLQASLKKFILDDARKLAPVTQVDITQLANTLGTEGYTKRGLTQMMGILAEATTRNINAYKDTVAKIKPPPTIDPATHMEIWAPAVPVKPVGGGGNPYADKTDDELRSLLNGGR